MDWPGGVPRIVDVECVDADEGRVSEIRGGVRREERIVVILVGSPVVVPAELEENGPVLQVEIFGEIRRPG